MYTSGVLSLIFVLCTLFSTFYDVFRCRHESFSLVIINLKIFSVVVYSTRGGVAGAAWPVHTRVLTCYGSGLVAAYRETDDVYEVTTCIPMRCIVSCCCVCV